MFVLSHHLEIHLGSSSASIKEMYVSFIFTFKERTQQWFHLLEFKEHFVHTKNILLSILCWKALNFVSTVTYAVTDILTCSRNPYCWNMPHSTIEKLIFVTLLNLFTQYKLFFNLKMIKNTKINWIFPTIQNTIFP